MRSRLSVREGGSTAYLLIMLTCMTDTEKRDCAEFGLDTLAFV